MAARLDAHYLPPSSRISSRAAYPTFLSLNETAFLQLRWAWRGLHDAFRLNIVFSAVTGDAEIRSNLYKSFLLNSLSLASIYTFDFFLLPLVKDQQKWLHRNVGWFYQVLWLLPVVGASYYLNNSWCSTIAKRTYTLQYGMRTGAQQPTTYTGMLTALATSAYRVVMVFTSVMVSFILRSIPFVGNVAGFIFLCWIDSYYCFEFVWIARGMSLSRRIRHLEERWAYYFAFGFPSAALCTFGSGLANVALFALVFPVYIILAMHARPVPIDPYNPAPSTRPEDNDIIRHPSPFIPIRIPIFSLVTWLNDMIVRILSVGGGGSTRSGKLSQGRSRTLSDPTEIEEGEVVELTSLAKDRTRSAPTHVNHMNPGRRKLD
ncbi:hypothetical protein AX16_004237 [Volvariella volvacea WC 439]|nr:hypothetical protein AX16_004237 [Volvariella volvacea WC 439]